MRDFLRRRINRDNDLVFALARERLEHFISFHSWLARLPFGEKDGASGSSPNLMGHVDDERQFGKLGFDGDVVA